jgi:enamine deaminase RidA (YjgF/YER057c/UK114 family)
MMNIYARLEELGIHLPEATSPAASYASYMRSNGQVYLSGHLARKNGKVWVGQFGSGMATEQGIEAARGTAIDLLSTLHAATGDLNSVSRILKLTSMVNSTAAFCEQHRVTNGASELLAEVFGEAGIHARSAIGVAQLPLGACLEIELIVQLKNDASPQP